MSKREGAVDRLIGQLVGWSNRQLVNSFPRDVGRNRRLWASLEQYASFLAACGFAPAQRFRPSARSRERPTITRMAPTPVATGARTSVEVHPVNGAKHPRRGSAGLGNIPFAT